VEHADCGLTAEDHAYRHAADAYFSEKGKLAQATFDAKLLPVFLDFQDHWRDFFAPADGEKLREYLMTPFEVRQAQFERFMRECRAWEVSFRHCTRRGSGGPNGNGNGSGHGHGPAPASGATDWRDLKRRLDAQ